MTRLPASPSPSAARIVLVCGLSLFIIFGIRLSFSVFFAEFVLAEGWSSEAAATIFSLNMLVFAVTAPLAGIALDRYGPRPVFGLGACLMAGGLWLCSEARALEDLRLAYGLVVGAGLGITGLGPQASVVAGWVGPARRGRALGIAFAGTGAGSLAFVPLANGLIARYDWRSAYLALALVCLLLLLPLMTVGLRRPPVRARTPSRVAQATGNWRALLRMRSFWALMLVGLTALGPLRSLTVHQVALMESAGVERSLAAAVVGIAGLLASLGFVAMGWFSDLYGRTSAFSIGAAGLLGAVALLLAIQAGASAGLLFAYAVLYALGESTRSSQSTALASDIFQQQGLGRINGLVGGMFGLGAALGPWLVGRIHDDSGSYAGGLLLVAAMVLVSLVAFVMAGQGAKGRKVPLPQK
ncbi:MAG: MFS transporter [Chloroflexi bacterium]|nr:MFS transporter [Chloroflexota bacterium]MCY3582294.1 MFS transporter [Chloroflexota bacterium]MCY3717274.1 MFS transporter [Chloroflexota bacterium]MDE2651751.1 MFS transporter [Chloroflexota bacterium]MXV93625.1 MFS transporter [Chloroflexota bacterium]